MSVKPDQSDLSTRLLSVNNLAVEFDTYGGIVHAVRDVSFSVNEGKTLAIVGESGCGKSVTVQSIMGLIPMPPGRITNGTAKLRGHEILGTAVIEGKDIRGSEIGMIFQDPMTSLNPTMTIGDQIAEPLQVHLGYDHGKAHAEAIQLLELTKIPESAKRAKQYPFEFSGGMLQRAMIAMAISCKPSILIADEPTTALDVVIQDQILNEIKKVQDLLGLSLIYISHDIAVIAEMTERMAVMYAGRIVESGPTRDIFANPKHSYTKALLESTPSVVGDKVKLNSLDGEPPSLIDNIEGCSFAPRCPNKNISCNSSLKSELVEVSPEHFVDVCNAGSLNK